jgi:hypothetical protein
LPASVPQQGRQKRFRKPATGARAAAGHGRGAARRGRRREPEWVDWPDERLLDLRLCDLGVRIEGTELEWYIERLYLELARKGLVFRPYFWLSDEFFTPDGHSGCAIPFYLAHPRLRQLERRQMYEVEGGTETWCMRILRHEVGHVLDNAYRLHFRRRYRELFGRWSAEYPEHYQPKPYSKSYVIHLDMWYAQAHPAEDFAETFAVWMRPGSPWRQRYADWPALRKLKYVDELMGEIAGEAPAVSTRRQSRPLRELRHTLREHYAKKRAFYGTERPNFYENDLRRLFSDDRKYRRNPTAASFLRKFKPELRQMVARWTGEYRYTIEQVLNDIIARCQELRLRLVHPPERSKLDTIVLITVQTMNYLHAGNHRVAL